jgi:sugar lactone lactonase YvrE
MTGAGWVSNGPFGAPDALCVGPDGKIYVNELLQVNGVLQQRVVRMDDMTGAGRATLSEFGGTQTHMRAMVVDADGRIYVLSEIDGNVASVDDFSGANLKRFGSFGNGVNQFAHPWGIWKR